MLVPTSTGNLLHQFRYGVCSTTVWFPRWVITVLHICFFPLPPRLSFHSWYPWSHLQEVTGLIWCKSSDPLFKPEVQIRAKKKPKYCSLAHLRRTAPLIHPDSEAGSTLEFIPCDAILLLMPTFIAVPCAFISKSGTSCENDAYHKPLEKFQSNRDRLL